MELSDEDVEGFEFLDIVAVSTGDIDNSDEFGTASRADVYDELVEIFHNEVESHACAALFLFDLVVSHGKASREVCTDFLRREGSEAIADGDNELRAIACESEEACFFGLEFDGNGSGLACVGSVSVWIDGGVIDSVHEELVRNAGDGRYDALVDTDI